MKGNDMGELIFLYTVMYCLICGVLHNANEVLLMKKVWVYAMALMALFVYAVMAKFTQFLYEYIVM